MASEPSVSNTIYVLLSDYLKQTPKAVAFFVMSYFSGHLWVFVFTAFLRSKTKGNKLLLSMTGKTAIGLLWFTSTLALIYRFKFGAFNFEYLNMLDVVIPSLIAGLVVQMFVFTLFVTFGDRK